MRTTRYIFDHGKLWLWRVEWRGEWGASPTCHFISKQGQWVEDRGHGPSMPLFCQQSPFIWRYREMETSMPSGKDDFRSPCFYLCIITVLVFFFFSLLFFHESTATGFLDCSSVWSFEQQCAPCSRGSLAAFGVALVDSPQWVNMGREGKGRG